jgi:transposase InsO family protein
VGGCELEYLYFLSLFLYWLFGYVVLVWICCALFDELNKRGGGWLWGRHSMRSVAECRIDAWLQLAGRSVMGGRRWTRARTRAMLVNEIRLATVSHRVDSESAQWPPAYYKNMDSHNFSPTPNISQNTYSRPHRHTQPYKHTHASHTRTYTRVTRVRGARYTLKHDITRARYQYITHNMSQPCLDGHSAGCCTLRFAQFFTWCALVVVCGTPLALVGSLVFGYSTGTWLYASLACGMLAWVGFYTWVAVGYATLLMIQVCMSIARWPSLLMAGLKSVGRGILSGCVSIGALFSTLRWWARGLGKCVWGITVGWLLWDRRNDSVLGWAYRYTPYHGRDRLLAWWKGYPSIDVLPGLYMVQRCASARAFMISGSVQPKQLGDEQLSKLLPQLDWKGKKKDEVVEVQWRAPRRQVRYANRKRLTGLFKTIPGFDLCPQGKRLARHQRLGTRLFQLFYGGSWSTAFLAKVIQGKVIDKLPFAIYLEFGVLKDPSFRQFAGFLKRADCNTPTPTHGDKVWVVGNCVQSGRNDNRQHAPHSSDPKGSKVNQGLKMGELGEVSFSKPGYERFSDVGGEWAKALKLECVSQGNLQSPDYTAVVTPHVEIGFGSGETIKKGVLDCGAMVSLGHPDHIGSYEGVTKKTSRPYVLGGISGKQVTCNKMRTLSMRFGSNVHQMTVLIPDSGQDIGIPPLLLGMDFLLHQRVVLDFHSRKWWFSGEELAAGGRDMWIAPTPVGSEPPEITSSKLKKKVEKEDEKDLEKKLIEDLEAIQELDENLKEFGKDIVDELGKGCVGPEEEKKRSMFGRENLPPDPTLADNLYASPPGGCFPSSGQSASFDTTASCFSNFSKTEQLDLVEKVVAPEAQSDRKLVLDCLKDELDAFAYDSDDLEVSLAGPHYVETKQGSTPVHERPRRYTPRELDTIWAQLQQWLDLGVIRRSFSEWSANVVLVDKTGGEPGQKRLCIDYKRLNSVTVKDAFPVPRMDETIDTLQGANWFTKLDLLSGYLQISIHPDDRPKTSFNAGKYGKFEFNSMPFGLTAAPATFQRIMERIMRGAVPSHLQGSIPADSPLRTHILHQNVLVYIDDIIVYTKGDLSDHMSVVQDVLKRLQLWKLQVSLKKCLFAAKEVEYLGFLVSGEGVRMCPSRTESVRRFTPPTTKKQLQSFLGFINAFRRFVPHLARITRPLRLMLKNEFEWKMSKSKRTTYWYGRLPSEELSPNDAFELLKKLLTEAPCLHQPDFSKRFFLRTDSSKYAMGSVLYQLGANPDERNVIGYAARSLKGHELNWHINEKEAFACVYFVNYFRCYLHSEEFTLETDSKTVAFILKSPTIKPEKLARWCVALQEYNFAIVPLKGIDNVIADVLSRWGEIPTRLAGVLLASPVSEQLQDFLSVTTLSFLTGTPADSVYSGGEVCAPAHMMTLRDGVLVKKRQALLPSLKELIDAQKGDDICSRMRNSLTSVEGLSPTKFGFPAYSKVVLLQDLLHFCTDPNDISTFRVFVPPGSLRRRITEVFHDNDMYCHTGPRRMDMRAKTLYFWPRMVDQFRTHVKTCTACQQAKRTRSARAGLSRPKLLLHPFDMISIDLKGPLPMAVGSGNCYILSIMDCFTRFYIAIPIKSKHAHVVVDALVTYYLTIFPVPTTIVSDNGSEFSNSLMTGLAEQYGFTQRFTPVVHQQSNQVERVHRTLGHTLKMYCQEHGQRVWPRVLPLFCNAYNNTPVTGIGLSPIEIVFCRPPSHPAQMTLPTSDSHLFPNSLEDHVKASERRRKDLHSLLGEMNKKLQWRNKQAYDKNRFEVSFEIGQKVWLWREPQSKNGLSGKLMYPWEEAEIVEKMGESTYNVRRLRGLGGVSLEHVSNISLRLVRPQKIPEDVEEKGDGVTVSGGTEEVSGVKPLLLNPDLQLPKVCVGDVVLFVESTNRTSPLCIGRVVEIETGRAGSSQPDRYTLQYFNTSNPKGRRRFLPAWLDTNDGKLVYANYNAEKATYQPFVDTIPESLFRLVLSDSEATDFLATHLLPSMVLASVIDWGYSNAFSWIEQNLVVLLDANTWVNATSVVNVASLHWEVFVASAAANNGGVEIQVDGVVGYTIRCLDMTNSLERTIGCPPMRENRCTRLGELRFDSSDPGGPVSFVIAQTNTQTYTYTPTSAR